MKKKIAIVWTLLVGKKQKFPYCNDYVQSNNLFLFLMSFHIKIFFIKKQ